MATSDDRSTDAQRTDEHSAGRRRLNRRTLLGTLSVTTAAGLTGVVGAGDGGSSQVGAEGCGRSCLEGWIDRYFDAVIDNAPGRVPLADDVRFTENGQRLRIGDGLWHSMQDVGSYRLVVSDVPAGVVAMLGTIREDSDAREGGLPTTIALRLSVEDDEISEIEQMVIRRDAETAEAIEEIGEPREAFHTAVPADSRMSRGALIETANEYFSGMQQNDGTGDYPFAENCNRIENGMQTTNVPTPEGETEPDPKTSTNYSPQWSCEEQFESGLLHFVTRIRDRRFVAVDRERGVVFSFAFFDHAAGETRTFETPGGRTVTAGPAQPWTWYIAEAFKIHDGLIGPIEAVLMEVPYGMLSGWSNWAEGMSDSAHNVTGYAGE